MGEVTGVKPALKPSLDRWGCVQDFIKSDAGVWISIRDFLPTRSQSLVPGIEPLTVQPLRSNSKRSTAPLSYSNPPYFKNFLSPTSKSYLYVVLSSWNTLIIFKFVAIN